MKKSAQSLGHAVRGLVHALKHERNLRMFVLGHALLLLLGIVLRVDLLSLLVSTLVAGIFVSIELLNTAIERLADTVDDCEKTRLGGHFHVGIKQAKDVASAAALIMLAVYAACIVLIALPYVLYLFLRP